MDIHRPTFSNLSLLTSVKLRPTLGGDASAELTAAVLVSTLDICFFSEIREQAVRSKGLPGFCWKLPAAPRALFSSYHCR